MSDLQAKRKKKSKRRIAQQTTRIRMNRYYITINGVERNVIDDYLSFLNKLDTKDQFKKFAHLVLPFSAQWNQIRRKHLTASKIKKISQWKSRSPYIFKFCSKYISNHFKHRGSIIENYVRKLLKLNNYDFKDEGLIWIHKNLKWLSCTTDGILYENDKVITALEIKSYTSSKTLHKAFHIKDDIFLLKETSTEYCQMQIISEIIDIPYVILVFEWNMKIRKVVVKRDLDFLHDVFEKLKVFYFRYLIPYLIYTIPLNDQKSLSNTLEYFTDYQYKKMMDILEKNEYKLMGTEESIYFYYSEVKPSEARTEYFAFNEKKISALRIITSELEHYDLCIYEDDIQNEMNHNSIIVNRSRI